MGIGVKVNITRQCTTVALLEKRSVDAIFCMCLRGYFNTAADP